MKKLAEILGREWINQRVNELTMERDPKQVEELLTKASSMEPNVKALVDLLFKNKPSEYIEAGTYLQNKMKLARFEYIRGADIGKVKGLYWDGAVGYTAVLDKFEFKRKIFEHEGCLKSTADRYVKFYGAQAERKGNYYKIRFENYDIPHDITVRTTEALFAAVISGDWGLAERICRRYPIPEKAAGPIEYGDLTVLAALLLKRDDVARESLENEPPGYPQDFLPKRRELLKGVLRSDVELFKEGLKKTNVRYKGMWDEKKYQKMWAKGNSWRKRYPEWEKFWDFVKAELVEKDWVISEFAVTCIRLAVRRGMDEVLKELKLNSECVPFALACDVLAQCEMGTKVFHD